MYRLLLLFLFCTPGITVGHSKLMPQGDDGETNMNRGCLHERLSRIEAVLLADDTLSKRLGALEKEIKRIGEENKLLRDEVKNQDSTLKQLEVEIKKLRSDNVALERFCKETSGHIISTEKDEKPQNLLFQKHLQTNQTAQNKGKMTRNNDERIGGKYEVFSSPDQFTKKSNHFRNTEFIRQRLNRQSQGGQFAFYSTVSVWDLTDLGIHHPIVFDYVITNIGGAYHPNTGVFITPVDGVYVFNLGAMSCGMKAESLELVKDGSWIQSVYPDAHCCDGCASDSLVAVLELNKGNEVWVRTAYGSGQIHGQRFTFFSGWLLFVK